MNNVRYLRNELKLSQAELASALGLTQSALSHYETGACDPLVDTGRKLIAVGKSRGFCWTLDHVYTPQKLADAGQQLIAKEAA